MKAVATVVFGMAALLVASSPSRAQGIAPFDLIWDAIDVNGLPVDPSWGYQLIRGPADPPLPDPGRLCNNFSGHSTGNPPCVKQPIWWEPAGIFCDGHVNWRTVSYAGPLYWDVIDGHSSLLLSDDYNFWLAPPGPTTLTTASPQVLQLAFNSDETIDHFHTPWWEAFRGAVADGRGTVVNTDYAVVIGLLGLHCEHSCVTEIHPVYAMAIHDPIRRSPNDDVWAIFVRNWGDQGFCASGMNTVSLTSITPRLPWRRGSFFPFPPCGGRSGRGVCFTSPAPAIWPRPRHPDRRPNPDPTPYPGPPPSRGGRKIFEGGVQRGVQRCVGRS